MLDTDSFLSLDVVVYNVVLQGFCCVLSGEIWPHSQQNLGDFFPNFEKNPNLQKKKKFIFED